VQVPRVAFTLGDPGGVGPELVARVVTDPEVRRRCRPLVVGDTRVLEAGAGVAGVQDVLRLVSAGDDASAGPEVTEVLAGPELAVEEHVWGALSADNGRAALAALRTAVGLAVNGVVSAPLNKQALKLAGMAQADELEHLADVTGSPEPLLIGVLPQLWTCCVTLHVPLAEVPPRVTRAAVRDAITRLAAARARARPRPRIAVAALNPHAGEGGHLGTEERDALEPAVRDARSDDIDAVGPLPADTIFPRAFAEGFDGVVCMYHDQANIARKLQPMDGQATLFLGLPVPVATTAHGTAYDRAGSGTARPDSLRAALQAVLEVSAG
jgi:4-hydroxythreonine-4-phosphate dehydrogenase